MKRCWKSLQFTLFPNNTYEGRLEKLHDLFKIIYSDAEVDQDEITLLKKYAIAIGFSAENAGKLLKRSIQVFSGKNKL